MDRTILFPHAAVLSATAGPLLIAVGLAGLLVSAFIPAVPVVTAMAILTLGATDVTLARFGGSPAFCPIIILHAATYAGLYGLFIGATLHAAAPTSLSALRAWTMLDIAASTVPMAMALQHVLIGLRQQFAPKR